MKMVKYELAVVHKKDLILTRENCLELLLKKCWKRAAWSSVKTVKYIVRQVKYSNTQYQQATPLDCHTGFLSGSLRQLVRGIPETLRK